MKMLEDKIDMISKLSKKIALFIWYRIIAAFFRMLPIKKNKIVFDSFLGKGYSDNPKFLAEEFLERGEFELVWIVTNKNQENFPERMEVVKHNSLAEIYHLATAKVWIDNCRKHYQLEKRKEQFYVQTWHGNIAGKKVEADVLETLSEEYIKCAQKDSEMADVFLSGSKWASQNYRDAFWYKGKILEYGLPRADIFYQSPEKYIKRVYEYYNLNSDEKLAIYAPTFRTDDNFECYSLNYKRLLKYLETEWGGKWKILVRLHPHIQNLQNMISYDECILNGSEYKDISELIIASELLITDYSGCMFDAMETGKKVLLFATDIQDYMLDRGTYFSFDELPFLLAENNDELCKNIQLFDEIIYKKKVVEFMKKCGFCNCDNSTKRIVDYIVEQINKQEN